MKDFVSLSYFNSLIAARTNKILLFEVENKPLSTFFGFIPLSETATFV